MDRFETLRAFAATIDEGGLAAAGRKLGRSPAAMTRAIAELEQDVGSPVLERTTRTVRLTEAGEQVLELARTILADFGSLQQIGRDAPAVAQGTIAITAPLIAGIDLVRPVVDDFLALHPAVSARLLLQDRIVNLVDEGIDVALRIAHLPDSTLVARRVGTVRTIVCAAPAYLANRPPIRAPGDLAGHAIVSLAATRHADRWTFARRGSRQHIRVTPRLSVTSAAAALRSVIDGVGVGRLLSYQVADAVRAGQLTPLLTDFEPPPLPVHLIAPKTRLSAVRTRAFVDFAMPRLRTAFAARTLDG